MASSWKLFSIIIGITFPFQEIFAATDTISTSQSITDGEFLVSSGGRFELGFFTPGNSSYRYLGLWYKNHPVQTVVWVANREAPLANRRGVLRVIHPGLLVLLNETNHTIWSTNASRSRSVNNPIGQLLDNGNVVVRDANDDRGERILWESFNYLTDTYLPGMNFGWNLLTGLESFMSSWKSPDDPAPGQFSYHLDLTGYPHMVLKDGASVVFRTGPWNGNIVGGGPTVQVKTAFNTTFVMNENEVIFRDAPIDRSVLFRTTLGTTGVLYFQRWVEQTQEWIGYMETPSDRCDAYGLCGAHGICNAVNSPPCVCLDRFVPKDSEGWDRAEWKNTGCIRRSNLSCQGDVFLKYSGVKLPDVKYSWHKTAITLEECRRECARNCSCMAYSQLDIRRRDGCLFWSGELLDIRSLTFNGQDIYIRLASSESESERTTKEILIASLASAGVVILILILIFLCIRQKRKHLKKNKEGSCKPSHEKDSELPSFDLSVILKSTNHFSIDNKLGEGGFGLVYKGVLEEGQEIAVKRLSKDSVQGHNEFKNEVIFIAKLQHRNLVRLLGCCIQGDEKLLVYEYLPNKSLDAMLFDQTKKALLDWPARFNIINGIARGLLYLHQDSRLRIIHRDLKASNVLLDADMNPKISDFGIARSFGGNEMEAKTRRVIGTYGYMSPEYAVDGLFSIKSDVFSFGVLMLEIVSGTSNRGFSHDEHSLNLLGHAWKLYSEGRSIDLVEDSLQDSFSFEEMKKSIHVGLLCVQQRPEDRPTMSSVVFMLGNEGAFPEAKKPGFFTERDVANAYNPTSSSSTNEITITMPEGR